MALFRQKGRATWQARIWSPTLGRVVSVTTGCTDRTEAALIERQLAMAATGKVKRRTVEEALNKLFGEQTATPPMLLSDAAAEYRRLNPVGDGDKTGRERHSLVCSHWGRFVAWCQKKHPLVTEIRDVDHDLVRAFARDLERESASACTAKHILFNAARLYRQVMPRAGVGIDSFHGVTIDATGETKVRALTLAEYEALISATAGSEYGGAILVSWYSGLRYADVANLKWDQIADDAITLKPHKTKRHGIRVRMPLHPKVRAYLDSIPERSRGEYVFPELASTYGRSAGRFAAACKAAGITNRVGLTVHSIRHAFVTRLSSNGVPEDVRRKLVGHSKTSAVHDLYDHDWTRAQAAVNALD